MNQTFTFTIKNGFSAVLRGFLVITLLVSAFTNSFADKLFKPYTLSNAQAEKLDSACSSYKVVMPDATAYLELIQNKSSDLTLAIPTPQGDIVVNLSIAKILTDEFTLTEQANGIETPVTYNKGLYYQGTIANDPSSKVAISFFSNGQIIGVAYSKNWHGNLVIGRLEDNSMPFMARPMVVYNDLNLTKKNPFTCHTPDVAPSNQGNQNQLNTPGLQGLTAVNCRIVKLYLEGGSTLYLAMGNSVTATTNYITGLINVSSMLYDNEVIAIAINRIKVNTTPDLIPTTTSNTVLDAFSARMDTSTRFVEPVGHYFTSGRGLGGLAYVGILCTTNYYRTGMSDVDPTYLQLPTYSWSVEVTTHEMGHNLGSNHTQWCGWNKGGGIIGQIDSCYATETVTGGQCYTGVNIPRVGTIMSYCHLNGSIDFALGFGPLPGASIRNGVSGASCLPSNTTIATPTITAGGPVNFCAGDSVLLTANGGVRYIWSTGQTGSSIKVSSPGSYTVNSLLGTCRSAQSAAIVVTNIVSPTLPIVTALGSTTLCTGESVILSSSLATGNRWYRNGIALTGQTAQTLFVNQAGSYYTQTAPNANGCIRKSTTISVTLNYVDRTRLATVSSNNICPGTQVQLRSNSNISSQITGTNNNVNAISAGPANTIYSTIPVSINRSITANDTIIVGLDITHTYDGDLRLTLISPTGISVVLSSLRGGSGDNYSNTSFSDLASSSINTATAPFTGVFIPANPLSALVGQPISGNWTLEVADLASGDGGTLNNWYIKILPRNSVARLEWRTFAGALLDTTENVSVSPAVTSKYVLAKTNFFGCVAKDTVTVTVQNLPPPTVTASGVTTFCNGGTVTLTSSVASNIVWSNGATTPSIIVNRSGTYTVRQIGSGCTSLPSNATAVTVISGTIAPTINVTGSTTFCAGDSVILSSTSSTGNIWSNGATTQSITVRNSGSYSVTVIASGCTSAQSAPVAVTRVNTASISALGATTLCTGENVTLRSSSISGNQWYKNGFPLAGATGQDLVVTQAGNYFSLVGIIGSSCYGPSNLISISTTSVNPAHIATSSTSGNVCAGTLVQLNSNANRIISGSNATSVAISPVGANTITSIIPISISRNILNTDTIVVGMDITHTYTGDLTITLISPSGRRILLFNNLGSTGDNLTFTSFSNFATIPIFDPLVFPPYNGLYTPAIPFSGLVGDNTRGNWTLEVIDGFNQDGGSLNNWSLNILPVNGCDRIDWKTLSGTYIDSTSSVVVNPTVTSQYVSYRTFSSGCVVKDTLTVNILDVFIPNISAGGPTTFCDGGTVVLTSSFSFGNIWSNGSTARAITVIGSGTYSVRRIFTGCTSVPSSPVTVTVVSPTSVPTITTSGSPTICGGGSVVLTSSATSGNVWSTGETTPTISVNTAGSYTVRQVLSGCSSLLSAPTLVTVSADPSTPSITASGSTTICAGNFVTLTSSATTGNLWSSGETSQTIVANATGNYTVRQIVGSCTSTSSAPTSITVNPLPNTPIISASGPTTICAGNSVTLTSSVIGGNLWSNGATSNSITVNTGGNYSVRQIVGSCSSALSSATSVTITALPSRPTITASGSTSICAGSFVTLTSSVTSGNLWSTGETSRAIVVSTAGSYTVSQVVGTCTSTNSTAVVITINPSPSTPTITASGSTTFCAGNTVTLTSSATSGNIWSNGATSQSIVVNFSGDYSVSQVVGSCTSASSAATTVNVNLLPNTPTISVSGATTFCEGSLVTLTSSVTTGNLWSNGATTRSITVTTSGNYTLRRVLGGCTSATSIGVDVTVNPLPTAPTVSISGSTLLCGSSFVTLISSALTGNLWSTGETSRAIVVSNGGSYSVRQIVTGCTSSSSLATNVVVVSLSTPTISASGPTTICAGGTVTLTSNATIGNRWSNGDTTQSITVNSAGNYSVYSILGNCTSATSAATTVTINGSINTPTITASGPTNLCAGGLVTLISSVSSGNLWSTGETSQAIVVTTSGSYSLRKIVGTCTSASSAATDVTVNALPNAPTISASSSTTICAGNTVTLTSSVASGNLWSTGETSQSIVVQTTGNYTVRQIIGICTSVSSLITRISVTPLPATPSISSNSTATFCQGGSITLTSSSIYGNIWNTGDTTESITVNSTGSYSVRQKIGTCTSLASSNVEVTVSPVPNAPIVTTIGSTTFCAGGFVTLSSSATTGNLWSTGETGQSITVSTSGSYSVLQVVGICTSALSAATEITVLNLPPTPSITANSATTFCADGTVTLSSSATTGNLWSNGDTTQSITVNSSGNYNVIQIIGACSSANSLPIVVSVSPLPNTPSITAIGTTTFCAGGSVTLRSSATTGNIWSTGETSQSITVNSTGSYTVTVVSGNCTSAISAPTTVTVNSIPNTPTVLASGPTNLCEGALVSLSSSALNGNLWNTGDTTNSILVGQSGNYSVRQIVNGCTSLVSQDRVVLVSQRPTNVTITELANRVLEASNGTVNAVYYTWFRNGVRIPNATASTYNAVDTGRYVVRVATAADTNCYTESAPYSVILATKSILNESISLFPNPASRIVMIQGLSGASSTSISIIDMAGRVISTSHVAKDKTSEQLSLDGIPAGTYVIAGKSNSGSWRKILVIKQ